MRTALCRVALFLTMASATAFSYPLTWTISGGTFGDGGTFSGTFVFDADTGSISNWNVVAGGGSTLGAFTYTPSSSFTSFVASPNGVQCPNGNCIYFNINSNLRYFLVEFASALTDNGGTTNITPGSGSSASYECNNCAPVRYVTAGTVSAPLAQTLTFDPIPTQILGTPPFTVAAQTNARLPVTFASTTTSVCTVAGDVVTLISPGPCSITASQAGNANFQPVSGSQTFNVIPASPAGVLNSATGSPLTGGNGAVWSVIHDFNGDGFPDIAVTNYLAATVSVFLGSASGTFTAATNSPFATGSSEPFGIVVGDFNGDGVPDIATSNYTSNSVSVLLGNGTGNFSPARGSPFTTNTANQLMPFTMPFSLAVVDVNGDGIQDLVTANDVTNNISVLIGSGTGQFSLLSQIPVGSGPRTLTTGDFNLDGIPDLAVANQRGGNVTILLGNGAGGFSAVASGPFTTGSLPFQMAVGDFNGDGKPDLAVANNGSNDVTVLLGDGTGNFTAAANSPFTAGTSPIGLTVADLDGDGIPDLAVTNASTNNLTVLLGDGTGNFTNAGGSPFTTGNGPTFLAAGDLNGDGIEDLVIPNNGDNTVSVLLGALSPTNSVLSTSASSTIFVGTPVPLTLTVSDTGTAYRTLTGPGTFFDNTTLLGGAPQTGSPYSFTASGLAAGSHTFSATYGGGSGSAGSPSNTITITVQKLPQTITFNPPPNVTFGVPPFAISASATSGLTVIFSSNTTSVCTVSGSTVTAVAPGTCSITANQPGDATYAPAPPVTQSFTVLQPQTITFNPLPNVVIGVAPFTISASASSGLTVTFTSNTTSVCTVSGTTVTAVAVGTCSITASQSGNAVYAAATPVTQAFTVLQTQIITFGTLSNVTVGVSPFVIGATATSGLAVVFTSNTTSVCTVTGNTVTIVGPGTCSITASQPGNATFAAATPVTQTFTVYPQLILSGLPTINTTVGASVSFSVTAMGGSGSYTYTISGLPAGLTASGASITGSPTQAGTFFAQITVRDTIGNSATAVLPISVLGLTTTSLPGGTVGQFYGVTLAAAGGSSGYTFLASGLPSGLTITPAGYLNGTPKAAGTFAVIVTVSSGGVTAPGTLSLTIAKAQPILISNAALPNGTANTAYSQTFSASGGFPPYTWSVSTGAPPAGLSLSSSGTLSGTATAPGSYSFGVMATDSAGGTATATASLSIQPQPLMITTRSLPEGMFGVNYPTQQFTVSGGAPPFMWSIGNGSSLPPGLMFTGDGVLSGTPQGTTSTSVGSGAVAHATTSGTTYQTGIVVTDSQGTQSNFTFSLAIRPPAADLVLTAGALNFALSTPASGVPPPQKVGVQSTQPSQPITYTLSMNPSVSWLAVSNGTTTPDSIQVSIAPAALTLEVGSYQTVLQAMCTSSSCQGNTQNVTVTLNVTAAPPKLEIDTNILSFATLSSATGTLTQPINVKNAGGGSLTFNSVACETPFCTVTGVPSLAGGTGAAIPVTVNPIGLNPGFYRTQVDIATSAGQGAVPVTFFIAPNATMALAPAGQQFSMTAGGAPGNANGSFLVVVQGSPIAFTAAIVSEPGIPAPSWLRLGTSTNSATSTSPGTVTFSIDPAAAGMLSPGAYYGVIEVSSLDVNDSPQNFEVVLNVAPANTPVAPDPQPAGLLFITQAGGTLPPQTVTVYSNSNSSATFQTAAVTVTGGDWLSVSPATGIASQAVPGVSTVRADVSKLSAGVYQGSVTYSLSATAVRSVNVTLIVTPAGGTTPASSISLSNAEQPHAAGCTPSALVPTQTGLVNSFSQAAGWPTPLQIQLSNNCGSAIGNGQIVATFSNGDPPLVLPVADGNQGLYTGTWAPSHATSQVAINVTASAPGFTAATSQITGAVLPNAVPVLSPNGTLHSFDPLVGGALAPGTIVAIYGKNLAGETSQPDSIPLPTTYNGTTVIIGGMQAPLYYVSPGQVNAQIPFELLPGSRYDVIVSANGALTTPQPIQLTPAAPGLAAFTDGTLIAQHSTDGSLVTQSAPAKGGEYLVAYLAGLGDTTVQVASGTASPSSPLAQPVDQTVLTINGNTYPTAFVGLTPGLVGLYQINFQAPMGLPAGNVNVVVTQNGVASNATVLPYTP